MKRLVYLLAFAACFVPLAFAQSAWEGNAVVSAYGEFPRSGSYGASNSFPLNSIVEVTNLANGKRTRVIIADRIDTSGIFLLVSQDAARQLEMKLSEPARVRVQPVAGGDITSVSPNRDLPFSPDPDVNPSASVGNPNESVLRPYESTQQAAGRSAPEAETSPEVAKSGGESTPETPLSKPKETPQPETAPEVTATPAPQESTPEAEKPSEPTEAQGAPSSAPEPSAEVPSVPAQPVPSELTPVQPVSPSAPQVAAAESAPSAGEPRNGLSSGIASTSTRLTTPLTAKSAEKGPGQDLLPPAGPATVSAPPLALSDEPSPPQVAERTPEEAGKGAPSPAVVAEANPVQEAVDMVTTRLPRKDLFPPPREGEVFTFLDTPRPAPGIGPISEGRLALASAPSKQKSETPALEPEKEAQTEVVSGPTAEDIGPLTPPKAEVKSTLPVAQISESRPGAESLGRIAEPREHLPSDLDVAKAPPEEKAAETPPATPPAPVGPGAVLSLEPAEPRPPEAPPAASPPSKRPVSPAATAEKAPESGAPVRDSVAAGRPAPGRSAWAKDNLPLVGSLESDAYYLQVGAYANPHSAQDAISSIDAGYPTAVLSGSAGGKELYRVFVGPLREDEKGSALYWVRAHGYRDAFVKRGAEQ